ncbi:MAG: hypothetical protein AAFR16_07430 [Pseudomonadota bacterium]
MIGADDHREGARARPRGGGRIAARILLAAGCVVGAASAAAQTGTDAPLNAIPGITAAPAAAPAAPLEPPRAGEIRDPEAAARGEIERHCLDVSYPPDFVQAADLTGDGLDDLVITHNVVCDGYHSAFCGVSGCDGSVWIALRNGYYRKLDLPPRIAPARLGDAPAVRVLPVGGCRKGVRCGRLLAWDGARFVSPDLLARRRAAAPPVGAPPARAAGPLAELEALDQARSDRWTVSRRPDGGAQALILSDSRAAALALACAPGDADVELTFRPEAAVLGALNAGDGAELLVDFVIGRNWLVETRALRFAARADLWRDRVVFGGRLVRALRRGTRVRVREPGRQEPLGRFNLAGSSQAVALLAEACR